MSACRSSATSSSYNGTRDVAALYFSSLKYLPSRSRRCFNSATSASLRAVAPCYRLRETALSWLRRGVLAVSVRRFHELHGELDPYAINEARDHFLETGEFAEGTLSRSGSGGHRDWPENGPRRCSNEFEATAIRSRVQEAGSSSGERRGAGPRHRGVCLGWGMAKTFRSWDVDQIWLLPPSVQELVSAGHVAHFVRETVRESLDLSGILDSYTEERGFPPYDPRMMTALLVYGYTQGVYSSRRLAQACEQRVDFMAVTALQQPDFRTINLFRQRHLQALGELFVQVLQLCRKGRVWSVWVTWLWTGRRCAPTLRSTRR